MTFSAKEKCARPSVAMCPCCSAHRDHVVHEGLALFLAEECSHKVNVVKVIAEIENA